VRGDVNSGLEYALPIKIGNNCWLGGGVIVLPGVTIGINGNAALVAQAMSLQGWWWQIINSVYVHCGSHLHRP
jgi:hypothetical protein